MENSSEPVTGQKLSSIFVLDHEIVVDTIDLEFVLTLGLSIVKRDHLRHVAINTQPYYKQYLHRVLLGVTDPDIIVDHRDNNGLNNSRDNLRKTDKVGNALNMRVNKNKKSGLPKGVYRQRGGYKAQVKINHLEFYLGQFSTVEAAEAAYLKKVKEYWDSHESSKTD